MDEILELLMADDSEENVLALCDEYGTEVVAEILLTMGEMQNV